MRYKKLIISFLVISAFFFFLRLIHLTASYTASTDQGTHILDIYNLYKSGKISFIGPSSSFEVNGHRFFFGPATYYISMPALVISGWKPFSTSIFMILVQYISLAVCYFAIFKKTNKILHAFLFGVIFTFFPSNVHYSQFLWNPNYVIPTATLLLACHLLLKNKKQKLLFFLMGFLWGLGLQFHLDFVLAILVSFFILLKDRRLTLISITILVFGFVVGYLPSIIFELRHNFYNTKTFLLFFLSVFEGTNKHRFKLPDYYFFGLIPFALWALTALFFNVKKINPTLFVFLVGIYALVCAFFIIPLPTHGFLMSEGWNYTGLAKAEKIIIDENPSDFNVADLLTGDSRAIYLRALLTLDGKAPMDVISYPDSQTLFLYTNLPEYRIVSSYLWEVEVMHPFIISKRWYLENGIVLYELQRIKKDNVSFRNADGFS